MKHIEIIGSVLAVVFGVSLVVISLISASQVQSKGLEVSHKEMYFEDDVLPDHALYPILMVRDRVQLELAQPEDRISLRVAFAQERMHSAEMLYEKGKPELALSTATKAQKYLLTAALEVKAMDMSEDLQTYVFTALREQTEHLKQLQEKYNDDQYEVLEKLIQESKSVFTE